MQIDTNRLIKLQLPNGNALDIKDVVFKIISNYTQSNFASNESGGLLIGYTQKGTLNVIIENVTEPQSKDISSRITFKRKDPKHLKLLNVFKKSKSDYLGTWHTHPQDIPSPSTTDFDDWEECLLKESTRNGYIIFLILGRKEFKVWAGDLSTKIIHELLEWEIDRGIYVKRG